MSHKSTDTWCVYKTSHPTGFTYIGKSSLRRVENGYQGSGRRLHCAFLQPGFEQSTWTTVVLETFLSEDSAYLREAELVTLNHLCNPFCMNDTPGGRGSFRGSPYALILKRNKKPRAKSPRVTTSTGKRFWEK